MVWVHGGSRLLVGDGPWNMESDEGWNPHVDSPGSPDDVGKQSVGSPRCLGFCVERCFFFFSWIVIWVWMTCVVVIASVKGYSELKWDVCPADGTKSDGDGIWSVGVVMEVGLLVEKLELEEDGQGQVDV